MAEQGSATHCILDLHGMAWQSMAVQRIVMYPWFDLHGSAAQRMALYPWFDLHGRAGQCNAWHGMAEHCILGLLLSLVCKAMHSNATHCVTMVYWLSGTYYNVYIYKLTSPF
jgi:hypothetical protein